MNTPRSAPNATLGIAFMLLAVLMFSLNDVLGKWLVATYSIGQVLFIRSLAGLIVLAPFVAMAGWRTLVNLERPWMMTLRVVLAAAEVASFYYAVISMPLADAITFWMASPIYVAALAPLLLDERVGWRRWLAIGIGFVGVLIALRPSSETLTLPALVAIFGSLCFALMMITGRALRSTPDIALVFWPTVGAGLLGAVAASTDWTPPTGFDLALLGLLGIIGLTAHACTNRSLILADAAVVTPYQYTLLVWAMIFGWLFFNEIPQLTTVIGGAIIVAAGLFIFFRERQLGKPPSIDPTQSPAG